MGRQQFAYHPIIGYHFIPGLKARIPHEGGGYLVRVNDRGFRCNRQVADATSASTFRALVFGDSFTAGDGVPNEQRYSDILETALPELAVYNFGLPGSGTDQQYLIYREFGRGLDHDFLIIAVLVENIRRIAARYRPFRSEEGQCVYYAKPFYELIDGELVLRHVPVPREPVTDADLDAANERAVDRGGRYPVLRRLAGAAGLRDVAQWATRYNPVPEFDRPTSPEWLLMSAILKSWISVATRPVLLVPLPLHQHMDGTSDSTAYQLRFREIAAETGCTLHDPLPDLLCHSAAARRGFRFQRDVHLTPAGHAAIAASLAPAVKRLLGRMPTRVSHA